MRHPFAHRPGDRGGDAGGVTRLSAEELDPAAMI